MKNRVICVGNVGREPEIRYQASGGDVQPVQPVSRYAQKNEGRDLDAEREDRRYRQLKIEFQLLGHTFNRSDGEDSLPRYYASKWGLVRCLETLEDAQIFLDYLQKGGRHVVR
jgi:hypothetical protein